MNSVLLCKLAKWCLVTVFVLLTSCEPGTAPVGPQVPTPASTGPAPTVRPEEDEPGWICTAADDSCDETSY